MSESDSRDIYKACIPPQSMDDEIHSDGSNNSDDNFQQVDEINDDDSVAGDETKMFPESDEEAPYLEEAIRELPPSDKEDDCTLDSIDTEKDLQTVIKSYRKRQAAERKKQAESKKISVASVQHIEPVNVDSSISKPVATKSAQQSTGKKSPQSTPTKPEPKKRPATKRVNVTMKINDEPSSQKKKRIIGTKSKAPERAAAQLKKRLSSENINSPSTSDSPKAGEASKNTLAKESTPRSNFVADVTKEQTPREPVVDGTAKSTWMKILASDFKDKDFKSLLLANEFTEKQANALQKSFVNVSNQIHNAYKSNDRFMKTHKCLDCEFSVSHQCMSIEYLQFVPSAVELTQIGSITPRETVMCMCKFGFYHAHPTSGGIELVNKLATKHYTNRLTEHCRTVKVSCPGCKMSIVMRSRNAEVCCDFSQWMSHDGQNRKTFFSAIGNRLANCKNNKPYLNELYTCNRQCCLIFHRCNSLESPIESTGSRPISLE